MRRMIRMVRFALVLLLALASPALAELRLAPAFGDHAVLQRGVAIPVSGRATPGTRIEIAFAGRTAETVADANGTWVATLEALAANAQPAELVVSADGGAERVVLRDVLVGDVWLCGGQSNMEWPVAATAHASEARDAARPTIRAFKMPHVRAQSPLAAADARWRVADPDSVQGMTAVGFFFAARMHAELEVPIGLLDINWGGTRIEPWLADGEMFRGMIAPVAPFPIRGILWYQGESNAGEAEAYAGYLTNLVGQWRRAFGNEALPFGIVQLAAFRPASEDPAEGGWSALRAAQAAVAGTMPHVGLVVTLDVGDAEDIHPRDKRTVGERLAAWALGTHFGLPGHAISSPTVAAIERADGGVRVRFAHADGLRPREGAIVGGFGLAGADGRFMWAEARIDPADPTCVLVSTKDVADPREIVYAWQNNPTRANLVNGAGLPAGPFRSAVPK